MNRVGLIWVLALAGVGGLQAGSFTPGVPNVVDLTTAAPGGGSVLNKNITESGYMPSGAPMPSGTPTSFAAVLFSGAQVPFDIASGGANTNVIPFTGDTNNVWAPGNAAGTQSTTIDVGNFTGASDQSGVNDVDQIWTMLNDWDGTGVAGTGISLVLSGFSDGPTPTAISETINLFVGADYRAIGNAVPQDKTTTDVAGGGSVPSVGTDCSVVTATVSGVCVTVYNNVFTTTAASNSYWLDVQSIGLGALSPFQNGWLNTITVQSKDGTGTQDKAILSAVTVDSTPEPGTVVLFATGLAGIVLVQLRRRKTA
jgi:hypothetical protein